MKTEKEVMQEALGIMDRYGIDIPHLRRGLQEHLAETEELPRLAVRLSATEIIDVYFMKGKTPTCFARAIEAAVLEKNGLEVKE